MKIDTTFVVLMVFVCFCFCFSSLGQENKKLDSVLGVYNSLPKDSTKAQILYDLYNDFLFSDINLSKKYAEEFLVASKEYGTFNQVGWANYGLAMVHRNIGNKDSCRLYNSKAKNIFLELDFTKGIIDTDKLSAILYDEDGRDDKAIELLLQNIEREIARKDTTFLANDYKHLAGIYADKSNYKLALQYCLKAIELYQQIDSPVRHADALFQMGSIEKQVGNLENAIENYSQALEIYIEQDDKLYQAYANSSLANAHFDSENYDQAEKYNKNALELAIEMKSSVTEGEILGSLGRNKIALKKFDEGIAYFQSAMALANKNERVDSVVYMLYAIAEAQLLKTSYDSALLSVNRGIEISKSIKNSQQLGNLLKLRSKIYANQGKTALAFTDYKSYTKIKDSLYTIEKSKQIEELRAVYDTEKKEQQIAQQEIEITLLEEKAKVSNLQKIALGGGLGLSALVLGFGLYGFRQKTKRNRLEKEKVDAELVFKKSELAFKKKELTTHALHLAKKNEVLEHIKQKAKELKNSENGSQGYQQLIHTINFDQQDDKNWENFTQYFEQVHKDFSKIVKTKYPEITKNELRLMALLKMNLSSKEIANILNISIAGVKKARNRLRKKLEITPEESLEELVITI